MNYEFVQYRREHRDQVLGLLVSQWGSNASFNSALFEWKYERNPYADAPLICLALHRGRFVGMRGAFAGRWQGGDPPRPFPGMCGADLFISPEHRGTGLFRQLVSASLNGMAAAGYSHTLTLSAVQLTFLGCLRMGWRCPGSFEVLRRESWSAALVRRAGSVARRLRSPNPNRARPKKRDAGPPLCFRSLDRASAQIADSSGGRTIVAAAPRPQAMAELAARVGVDGRIRHVREERFFAWRFADPTRVFRFLYRQDDTLEGYVVLAARAPARQGPVALVDWEATSASVLQSMLQTALVAGRFPVVTAWSASLSPHMRALLRTAGFRPVRYGLKDRAGQSIGEFPGLLVRPVRGEGSAHEWTFAGRDLTDGANWDLREVYAD